MTAPERRRPLPALAFIGALCVLTALVWFRVLHRDSNAATLPVRSSCPSPTVSTSPTSPKPSARGNNAPAKRLPAPSTISVLVLNSTERTGLAGRTGRQLHRQGFTITDTEDDKPLYGGTGKPIKGVGEIRYGPAAKPDATLLHYLFPKATMKPTDSSTGLVTLSLGVKYKKFVPMAKVRKELAHKGITLTTRPIATATATPTPTTGPGC